MPTGDAVPGGGAVVDGRDVGLTTWRPQADAGRIGRGVRAMRWLPGVAWRRLAQHRASTGPAHLIVAIADHFEPGFRPKLAGLPSSEAEQVARVEGWCRRQRDAVDAWRDASGRPLVHTYFFPAEEYYAGVVARLAEFALGGYGEIEVQLHHGVYAPDTAENTRRTIESFRDLLVGYGCLSRWNGVGPPRFAFVHGNWALANSDGGHFCGVDEEMQILADSGCFADFTLPSAPSPAQVSKTNSLYECELPLDAPAPHRRGRDLRVGVSPETWPLIVQGPLGLDFSGRQGWRSFVPRIENGELTARRPATPERMALWRALAPSVHGRPEWKFVKLYCHGLDPRDEDSITGSDRTRFVRDLAAYAAAQGDTLHFVTAREMVNIALAACDGHDGDPGAFRDYRLRRRAEPRPGA